VAAQATQGTAVQNTDYLATDLTINVNTYAGQQNVSRQGLERGRGTDEVIFADLAGSYSSVLDKDVIDGPGSGGRHKGLRSSVLAGNRVTYGGAALTGRKLLSLIADAVQRVNSVRFQPVDAIVMHPRRWGWLADQSDSNGRPLVTHIEYGPQNTLGVGNPAAVGLVGSVLGTPIHTDANIPTTLSTAGTSGSNEDFIALFKRGDLHLWEERGGVPRQFTFEETLGDKLQVKLVLSGYSAWTAEHHPEGVATITSTWLNPPTF
jgi:HK97 family phage major capsid protein